MKTLPSGVQFSVLKEGAGAPPPLGSVVKVHLTGWVVGPNRPQQQLRQQQQQQFIDTRATGMPQEYTLTRDALAGLSQPQTLSNKPPLIEGLVQVLLEMKPGEQRKVNVPSNLGYGSKGYLPIVPSRADLNFEVELVSFTPPAGKR
jgi:peptidylprolyl isomerase